MPKPRPRNAHVLVCNGADAPARRGRGRSAPQHWALWTFGGAQNVRLRVSDITDAMGQKLPELALDLLELRPSSTPPTSAAATPRQAVRLRGEVAPLASVPRRRPPPGFLVPP